MLIYLVGFMGSGKTTVGKKLAARMDFNFIDLDFLIEEKYHISIPNIFERFDEEAFRKLEHDTLKTTTKLQNTIVSTGGGTPCYFNNMKMMNEAGKTIYLKLHPISLYKRLTESKKKRPLILNKPEKALQLFIEEKLAERESFYNKAQYSVKGENLEVSDITNLL
jgi:shikimate kinase